MREYELKQDILEALTGDMQKNALDFIHFLITEEMSFIRGKGYWENQLYWLVMYEKEPVCFILVNGTGEEEQFSPFTIWTDDSGSNWFEDASLDEVSKKIVWENVDICCGCGGCAQPGGKQKKIFEKEFNAVCITPIRFINPDAKTIACVKELVLLRKKDILRYER